MLKNKEYDQPCALMIETCRLIQEIGIQEASFKTGLPFLWLQKLVAGKFKNPSVNRIIFAYQHLSGTIIL